MRGTTTVARLLRHTRTAVEVQALTQYGTSRQALSIRAGSMGTLRLSSAQTSRQFHATAPAAKKNKNREPAEKQAPTKSASSPSSSSSSSSASSTNSSNPPSQHPPANPDEPLDFADVKSRLNKASEPAQDALKKLKAGGRFNPDQIGALRVQPERQGGATYPLRELAEVVPKGGRTISILVHEEAYVKPVMSAIQASRDFNQQPQRDPDNELELVLKVEPDKREDVVKRVKAVCHEWRERVRQVRHKRDKTHAAWKKDGLVGPDLKRKLDSELDKIIKAKVAEIDAAEKLASKTAEGK
ncbi:ribosome recycling factor domain-containing protein [Xylariales sp. PMI_506]|nr:ribosome recycling factor domain-containing protein [Xylariales sp. PMI_506]